MIALGIILVFLVIIALIPLGAKIRFDKVGFTLWLVVGPFKLKLFPVSKNKKSKKPKDKKKETKKEPQTPQQQAASGGNVELIKQILPSGLKAVERFIKGLVINKLTVYYQVTDEDPAKAAMQYGVGWSVVGVVSGMIENAFKVEKRDIQVFVSFEENCEKRIFVLAELTIRFWRLIYIGVVFGIEFLKLILKKRKNKVNDNTDN